MIWDPDKNLVRILDPGYRGQIGTRFRILDLDPQPLFLHDYCNMYVLFRNPPLLQEFVKNIKIFYSHAGRRRRDSTRWCRWGRTWPTQAPAYTFSPVTLIIRWEYQVVQVGEHLTSPGSSLHFQSSHFNNQVRLPGGAGGGGLANPGYSLHFQSSHFNNQVRVPGGAGGGGPGQPRLQPTLSVQSL